MYYHTLISLYQNKFGFDLSYMKFVWSTQAHYADGRVSDMPAHKWAGCHTRTGIVYVNLQYHKAFAYYGDGDLPHILAHELAHEVYEKHASDAFKSWVINKAQKEGYCTPYLSSYNKAAMPDKYLTELFCEYLAKLVVG